MTGADPIILYFSDTGTKVPESCIFGQLLNITALLGKLLDDCLLL